jgi:hypothetical protein
VILERNAQYTSAGALDRISSRSLAASAIAEGLRAGS